MIFSRRRTFQPLLSPFIFLLLPVYPTVMQRTVRFYIPVLCKNMPLIVTGHVQRQYTRGNKSPSRVLTLCTLALFLSSCIFCIFIQLHFFSLIQKSENIFTSHFIFSPSLFISISLPCYFQAFNPVLFLNLNLDTRISTLCFSLIFTLSCATFPLCFSCLTSDSTL